MSTRGNAPESQDPFHRQFDYHFRAHVVPRLRTQAWMWAKRIASGECSYGAGYDALCRVANRLGAYACTEPGEVEAFIGEVLAIYALAAEEVVG